MHPTYGQFTIFGLGTEGKWSEHCWNSGYREDTMQSVNSTITGGVLAAECNIMVLNWKNKWRILIRMLFHDSIGSSKVRKE
jgi:hypothetical protein